MNEQDKEFAVVAQQLANALDTLRSSGMELPYRIALVDTNGAMLYARYTAAENGP